MVGIYLQHLDLLGGRRNTGSLAAALLSERREQTSGGEVRVESKPDVIIYCEQDGSRSWLYSLTVAVKFVVPSRREVVAVRNFGSYRGSCAARVPLMPRL